LKILSNSNKHEARGVQGDAVHPQIILNFRGFFIIITAPEKPELVFVRLCTNFPCAFNAISIVVEPG